MVAGGQPLSAVLDGLVRLAERHAEGMLCSVLILDDEGRLRNGAAPSLPASYCEAIDGISIGPSVGSCGTAAYRGSAVIVRDIATDPLWADYRDLALAHGLRACWSTPILAKDDTVLGTFAMYYGEPLDPTPAHRALIEAVTDIAGIAIQRARDEEKLRGAEERYRTLVEQVPAIVYTCRPGAGGDWLYVSPQVEEILGFTPEEWLAMERPWQERVHPEDRPRVLELKAQMLAGGRPLSLEYRMLRRDGETVWISDQAWVARDEHGTPVLLHGFLTDVTARKRAEQALRDSEERFRSIFESASVGIVITEVPSGRILRVNHAFEQLVGRTEAELFGAAVDAFTHPDDLPRKLELFEELLRGERESMRLVNRYLRPDGTVVVGDATGSLVRDESGTPIGYVGLVTDVTEQRRAEEARREAAEQLHAVIEASPLAILALDRAGFVRLWNPAATRLFGWTAEEVLGRTLPTVPEGLREEFDRQREQALLGTEVVRLETRRLHRDGTPIDVALFLAPLHGPDGEVTGHITLVEDIRARKQAEEERRRLEVQMQQAQRLESLGVLAGGIAHDFNNLLMAVMGNAGLAMMDVPPGPAYERIEQIQVAAERAADLTNQLLAYAGRASVQVEPVDVSVLVREMATLLEVSIPKKVALRLDLDDRLPAIEGDRAQLRQVVMNLITNAAEAVDGAEGTIALRTAVEELGAAALARAVGGADLEPGRYVCVTVEDTGSGMDEDTLAHIFEPFFTTKFAGRGLGLAAVLGIVRAHGGGILVDAAPGCGTTFRVLFPASDRAAEPAAAPRAGEMARRLSVLVVDDEPSVRGVARAMLERLGHTVVVAEHGEEALALVRGGADPDLVLLDMTMPVMDGRETLRALREVRPGLPVLLSSGYAEADLAGDGERWTGFVQKPYTPSALAEAIEAALEAAGGAAAPR
jgi:PAS domain S-box-containing protein